MIEYHFEEEKEYAIYYAKLLDQPKVLAILNKGAVNSKEEAQTLSTFFWNMIDKSIENEKNGVDLPWVEGAEFWSEKLLQTFSGHLNALGYSDIWDAEVDKQ